MGSVSEQLGTFAASVRSDKLPPAVRERTALALLDTIGVMIGARRLDEARPIFAHVEESGGKPEAVALGVTPRVPARAAAFANAWLADLLDLEDTYKVGGGHPGATVVPAALAMADRQGATGSEIMAGLVAGYEVANRLAFALFPHQGHHVLTTGTAGAIGAAAAAGRLLALPAPILTEALNIAAYLLPASCADTLWQGASSKPAHAAQAASVGVEAALLAARGFTAAPLDGPHGYLTVNDVTSEEMARATHGLGVEYTVAECAIKLYPCCGYAHGAIDAAIALHRRLRGAWADIDTVTVRSYDLVVDSIGGRYTEPGASFTRCQFSLPYLVAVALADGRLGIPQLTSARRADPLVHALAGRVRVTEDPALTAQYPERFPYEVEVMVRGSALVESVEAPRGTRQRPLTRSEIREKFDTLTEPALGRAASASLADAVSRLDALDAFSLSTVVESARDRPC
ncbi:MAG: hypothetical protein DMD83_09075 [Candidatus Rokuibacteriota bacterium]|nr:MAG: hypothetical protein DMD83_09075 [Candidatus Rokubacteria bacterium]